MQIQMLQRQYYNSLIREQSANEGAVGGVFFGYFLDKQKVTKTNEHIKY